MTMTKRWVAEYGGQLGMRPRDLIGVEGITADDMVEYEMPATLTPAYWLGQFLPWDSHRNLRVAWKHGFLSRLPSPANWWEGENLDNVQTGIHDFFCWLKYGYGRARMQLSIDIRHGHQSRSEAIEIARRRDGLWPSDYMGVPLESVLNYLQMLPSEFLRICNAFMNRELFRENALNWGQQLTLREPCH